jgi:hypothetical protein
MQLQRDWSEIGVYLTKCIGLKAVIVSLAMGGFQCIVHLILPQGMSMGYVVRTRFVDVEMSR